MTQPQQTALVIGASRGIGLALTQALVERGYKVWAAAREASEGVEKCGATMLAGVDITKEETLQAIPSSSGKINLLIIASGSQSVDKFPTVTKDQIRQQMETNAIGPLFTIKALSSQLQKGCKVVILSSKNGSITEVEATGGELYAYRMSKVAMNIAGKTMAGDLKESLEAPVALIHPGVVNTDMLRSLRTARGVPKEKLTANTMTPEESATKVLALVDKLTLENSGSFWNADTGNIIGW